MTTCGQIVDLIHTFLPFTCVAAKDNSGLLVGDREAKVEAVLMAVDLTEAVIDEAIRLGCGLIVTHHDFLGKGIRQITPESFAGRAVTSLLRHNIAFCVCHNNLDFLPQGTADTLMKAVGAMESLPLYEGYAFLATTQAEKMATEIVVKEEAGMDAGLLAGFGRVGKLEQPGTLETILKRLVGVVTGPVNVVGRDEDWIGSVAVQVGAGGRLDIDRAKACGADLLITGDVRHDDRLYAAQVGMALFDFCHYEVELPGILSLAALLRDRLERNGLNTPVIISQAPAPVRHLQMPDEVDLTRFNL